MGFNLREEAAAVAGGVDNADPSMSSNLDIDCGYCMSPALTSIYNDSRPNDMSILFLVHHFRSLLNESFDPELLFFCFE